jgi:peptidyl-prolyl cis-trans isomerase SurA
MKNHFSLAYASLVSMALVAWPAQAQLRATPQLGGSRAVAPITLPRAPDTGNRQADFIVAVVNSEPITNNEVRARLVRVEQQLAQQGSPLPVRSELARQVLERLIGERAQLQVARETGVRADDAMVDDAERTVARQNQLDLTQLRKQLATDGVSLSQFREELRNQLLLTRLRERDLDTKVRASDAEVDQFLRDQQGSSELQNMEINLAQVLVVVPENATPAQLTTFQTRAQQVLARALSGEDFDKLVREYSEAPNAAKTLGALGLRSADRYPPAFVQATQGLREGGISALVRTGAGFHILKVIEKRQVGGSGLSVVQTRARHILLRLGPQLTESIARTRLADYKRRIQAGQADFAALAREHSQDGSAAGGGDLGWANPGQYVPEFEDVMNNLAPGQMADPLTSRFGVHLIEVQERRQATLSQREQRELARNLVREKKLEEAYLNWAQDIRSRAYVELRELPQ